LKNFFLREIIIKNENHKNSQKNSKIKSDFKLEKKYILLLSTKYFLFFNHIK
jgi:hypothetical protein